MCVFEGGGAGEWAGECAPMTSGNRYRWTLKVVDYGKSAGEWFFGVCRPGIDVNDGSVLHDNKEAWMAGQSDRGW